LSSASTHRVDLQRAAAPVLPTSPPAAATGASAALAFYGRILGPLAGAYLAIGAALRLVLWAAFRREAGLSLADLAFAAAAGAANDGVVLVYLALPLLLLLSLAPSRLVSSRPGRGAVAIALYAAVTAALFVAVCEYFFFDEFESRFNLVAVDYLIYPTEVVGNIEESYPVAPLLAAIAVTASALWWPVWARARRALGDVPGWRTRLATLGGTAAIAATLAATIPSDALSLASSRPANELAMNGVSTFLRALRTEEIDYHQFYRTLPSERAFAIMRESLDHAGGRLASDDPTSLVRTFPTNPAGLGKLNVVVLCEESLGAQYVGAYGDDHGLTPVLDGLARDGLLLRNAFATGTRTARGLEAISASFPPIPSESIITRPGSEGIDTWGAVMHANGYRTSFLYGGFGAFDNMNHYFASNGFVVSDRLDIRDPKFTNVWGVSDEDLFRHAIEYFDGEARTGQPFFSIVMSTSNHKPFTFPAGIDGIPPQGGGRQAGVRYADHAIGRFFAEARTRPWFSDTLFVIIGDHDSRVYGWAEVPVEHYRVAALLYAPGRLPPGVSAKTFSSMDLAPTVLGLLGLPYSAPFYGTDVLDPAVPAERPVLFSHNHDVAIFEGSRLSVVGLQKQARSFLYRDGKTTEVAPDLPMIDLLTAQLQTAYELFQAHRY
jgi:phosphoglycerol transferase MdoB-like AlkP superfamily enzyme